MLYIVALKLSLWDYILYLYTFLFCFFVPKLFARQPDGLRPLGIERCASLFSCQWSCKGGTRLAFSGKWPLCPEGGEKEGLGALGIILSGFYMAHTD